MTEEIVELVMKSDAPSTKSLSMTNQSFLVSMGVSVLLSLLCTFIFCILRKRIRSVYEPRTFVLAKTKRMDPTPPGFFGWLPPLYRTHITTAKDLVGLDAYFFLRYLLLLILLCLFMGVPYISVLIPLHVIGGGQTQEVSPTFLDVLSTSNIKPSEKNRQIVHLGMCALGTIITISLFRWELGRYFRIKAEYLTSYEEIPGSTSTLLIKGIFSPFKSEQAIYKFFSGIGGQSVSRIWFNKDFKKLTELIYERDKIVNKLEDLELWLVQRCSGIGIPESKQLQEFNNNKDAKIVGNLWRNYLNEEDLNTMNGSKGRMMTWLKGELSKLNSKIFLMQQDIELYPQVDSCFVQFKDRLTCFIASRSIGSGGLSSPGAHIYDKIHPADVIWDNLVLNHWIRLVVKICAETLNYLFIFGWTFPVALISMLTQNELMSRWLPQVHWLVNNAQMSRMMSSVIAPLIVSGLTSQIPTFFRGLARLKGYPTNTLVEMDVQKYLFLFMFFQLFVIATLATGLPTLVYQVLLNTSEGAIQLANNLPRATTFFISYIFASCFTTAGNTFLQSEQLFYYTLDFFGGKTPRAQVRNICRHNIPFWGSIFPLATHIAVISIAYGLISPIILLVALMGLLALYVAFKYRILFCYVPRCNADGDYYPIAIFQLFSGLYCQQVSLIGALLVSQQPRLAFLCAVLLICTGVAHHRLRRFFLDWNMKIPLRQGEGELDRGAHLVRIDRTHTSSQCGPSRHSIPSVPSGPTSGPTSGSRPTSDCNSVETLYSKQDNAQTSPQTRSPISVHSDRTLINEPMEHMEMPRSKFKCIPQSPRSPQSPQTPNAQYNDIGNFWYLSSPESPESIVSPQTQMQTDPTSVISTDSIARNMWIGLFDELATNYNSLTTDQREFIGAQLFTHPSFKRTRPCIWIPEDKHNIARDQVMEMQTTFTDIRSSCSGVQLLPSGDFLITRAPPDFDPRVLMEL